MKSLDRIYYDSFANEYVTEDMREVIAPPERYLETNRGENDDSYIETWSIREDSVGGKRVQVAYTETDVEYGMVNSIRSLKEEMHNITLGTLLRWTIPANKFDEYVDRFGLGE